MTTTRSAAALRAMRPASGPRHWLMPRLSGPGGYYNIGNVLALATGVGLQFTHSLGSGLGGIDIVAGFLFGSPQAVAFTVASGIYIWSGEVYHRAFRGGVPDLGLTRMADLLSALGAVALTVSLIFMGQVIPAVAAGTLFVLGKLGSAMFGDGAVAPPFWPRIWPDPFRVIVIASRVPALAAPGLDLIYQLALGSPPVALVQPAVLIVCQLLWAWADLLLSGFGRRSVLPVAAG